MPETDDRTLELTRLPPGRKLSFQSVTLLVCAIASAGILALALPNIIGGDGFGVWMKIALLAVAAMAVSYGVNRLAVERGAPLANIGYAGAGIASVFSILAVGTGLWTATFSGLVLKDVAQLKLEEHGAKLTAVVAAQSQAASQAARVVPAISAVVADLAAKRDCEMRSSCLSGSGNGGRGPVARILEERLGRAEAIAGQVLAGSTARPEIIARLEEMLGRYQDILRSGDGRAKEKRSQLQALDGHIRQALGELGEAVPRMLVAAFAGELASGVDIPGRTDVSRQLTGILRGHAATLRSVISSIGDRGPQLPAFPGQVGVADALGYVGHFAPIAAITAVVELIFPTVLWVYAFLTYRWAMERTSPRQPRRGSDEDEAVQHLFALRQPALGGEVIEIAKRGPQKGDPRRLGRHDPER
ncbi:hypothetical protein [Siccirubricoccus phaeus]|uniref:hypothetical protein n=1 Tax=Siccirubricoccus phaeus TaxID=2595053 RepID=UPI0011F2DA4B|nr:hypothetical protein [Siccirubricoccus phaeus]